MSEKSHQILQIFARNSSILRTLTSFLLLLAILPLTSSQAASEFTVTGVCSYSNDPLQGYTCTLNNVTIFNSTYVLDITGTHLQDHTNDDVTSVDFKTSKILYFGGEVLRKFSNLKHLKLVDQGLKEIGENAFDVCPKLEELTLGVGEVTKLPSGMLRNCGSLKYFNANGLKIWKIPEDLFGDSKNLEEFWVPNNQLTLLPEKLLQNMQKLRIFAAPQNELKELSPNFFKSAVNLQEVNISKNEFEEQNYIAAAFSGLTNLTTIDLSSNDFPNFDFNFFTQFKKLEKLLIGSKVGVELTQISWSSLPVSLVDLTVYELGEDMPQNVCSQLVNLKSLSVTGYGIKNIHKDTFKSLGHLEKLSIQDTRIKALDSQIFEGLTSLSDLNLNYNYLNDLPVGIFAPLTNIGSKSELHGIHMYSNNIKRLNANFFGQHPHLRFLDFSVNLMDGIERGIFSRFHSNMTKVNLWANVCTDLIFENVTNLDKDERLNLCFDNWAGITTTTSKPGGCGSIFRKIDVWLMIIVGFVVVFMNYRRQ